MVLVNSGSRVPWILYRNPRWNRCANRCAASGKRWSRKGNAPLTHSLHPYFSLLSAFARLPIELLPYIAYKCSTSFKCCMLACLSVGANLRISSSRNSHTRWMCVASLPHLHTHKFSNQKSDAVTMLQSQIEIPILFSLLFVPPKTNQL